MRATATSCTKSSTLVQVRTAPPAVGLAEVTSAPYADPQLGDPKLVVVDVRPLRRLGKPVTLAEVKANLAFADFALVRQGRLSVVAVLPEHWNKLLEMAGEA